METSLQKKSATESLLTICVTPEDYQDAFTQSIREYAKQNIPKGFRKNSLAHLTFIKKRYSLPLLQELVVQKARESAFNYIKEHQLIVLGDIRFDEEQLAEISWLSDKKFLLTCHLDVVPEFQLVVDNSVHVTKHSVTSVSDTTLAAYKEKVRFLYGQKTEAETVALKDLILATIKSPGMEDQQISLSVTARTVDRLAITGKKQGEEIRLSVAAITYLNEILAPEAFAIKVESAPYVLVIKEIVRIIPAPLTQKLFDKLFKGGEVTSVAGFEEKAKEHLLKEGEKAAEQLFYAEIRNALLQQASVVLPEKYVKDSKIVAWTVILSKLAREYGVKVNPGEVIQMLVARHAKLSSLLHDMQPQENVQEEAERFLNQIPESDYYQAERQLAESKVMKFIESKITITSKVADTATIQQRTRALQEVVN